MTNALVVADDLTGAMDTGHGFAARGRGVKVRLHPGGDGSDRRDLDVLAVDTDSRDAAESIAAAAVTRAIDRFPAALVYKKVDSTLRGNVVAEIDAAVAATGADLAVVAPAFPAAGRTTHDGTHIVDGTPLAEAGYGVDESDLPTFLSPSRYPVSHVGTNVVDDGSTAVRARLAAIRGPDSDPDGSHDTDGSHNPDRSPDPDGRPNPEGSHDPDGSRDPDWDGSVLVACDARTDAHLQAVAEGAALSDADVLFVGSGGLAKHVAVPDEARPTTAASSMRPGVLGVVGSVNERTLAQLAAVPDDLVVRLDPAAAVRSPRQIGRDALPDLRDRFDRRGRAVVTGATAAEDVAPAEFVGAAEGVDAGRRVASALAAAASGIVAASAPGGIVLTGGAVARAVLTTLDASELALTGEAVADGVPEAVVTTGRAVGTRVVTKAGGFGDERTILNCLDALDRTT